MINTDIVIAQLSAALRELIDAGEEFYEALMSGKSVHPDVIERYDSAVINAQFALSDFDGPSTGAEGEPA